MRALFLLLLSASSLGAGEYFVAPGGSDDNAGTRTAPFASISRAQSAMRSGGGNVWLRGGTYRQKESLTFDERDSSATYASYPGERARLTGNLSLDPSWFHPITAGSPILYAKLREHGINDFGTLKARGWGNSLTSPMELFADGKPQTLARWPNKGTVARTGENIRHYAEPDVWMHGYWMYHWADFHLPYSAAPVEPTFGAQDGQPYYIYNAYVELDEPGEYYLDRTSGTLYYWPDGALVELEVSLLEVPVVVLAAASRITFRDLAIDGTRDSAVRVIGGHHVRFERCLIRNAGLWGVIMYASGSGVSHCVIEDCGQGGVQLGAGNRATLTPGNSYVSNNSIHRMGRHYWATSPGVSLTAGCGLRVTQNVIADSPHSGILFVGNNHLIEANDVSNVCKLSRDSGAIYTGRDWGYRGNVIRGNFIHDIKSAEGGDVHGVYIDDCASGVLIERNTFARVTGDGVNLGGGRDNIVINNIFASCGAALYNDDRGTWQINRTPGDSWNLLERLHADGIDYQQEPWASAYPACAVIPNDWAALQTNRWRNPEGSVFSNNIGWGNAEWLREFTLSPPGALRAYAEIEDNDPAHAPVPLGLKPREVRMVRE